MFIGAHILLYSTSPEADRAFFREILGFKSIDVGGGWLIFKLPPAEAAVHPSEQRFAQQHSGTTLAGAVLYLMCAELDSTVSTLRARGVHCTNIEKERWGIRTTIPLPSGGQIGLYQPTHPTALELV